MDHRRSIDLKTISCRGVSRASLYATIYLLGRGDADPNPAQRRLRHRHKTPLLHRRRDQEWDYPIRIYLDDGGDGSDLFLRFDLTAQIPLLPARLVGAVSVPVADLEDGALRHASYQVTSLNGKPNGVLAFSYIMNSPAPAPSSSAPAGAAEVAPPPRPPPPPQGKLYPSLADLIPDHPPPPTKTAAAAAAAPRVYYPAIDPVVAYAAPAQVSEGRYPAPPMDPVVAYAAPAQVSGLCYPAPPMDPVVAYAAPAQVSGWCYPAPPGSYGWPAHR